MPLPPALAAKLAKRGILNQQPGSSGSRRPNQDSAKPGYVEEVIAEDYDDQKRTKDSIAPPSAPAVRPVDHKVSRFHRIGHYGCPNKSNIYHKCVQFCVIHWGRGQTQPDPEYNRKRLLMLKKYPLPAEWKESFDPGSGRYYYWNGTTEEVSWLSPSHPRAVVGPTAAVLRERIAKEMPIPEPVVEAPRVQERRSEPSAFETASNRYKPYKKNMDHRRRKGKADDELDPMDPASYSDIPRGSWSSGLREESEGKTGVDSTATGPLFQQRPYPSPGDVLRANASKK